MASVQLPDPSTVATIDLARVLNTDESEIGKLIRSLEHPGYFYLDFRHASTTKDMAEQERNMYIVAKRYFDQSTEAKTRDLREGQPEWSDRGYKSCETDESFEMSTDELLGNTLGLPAVLAEQSQLIENFQVGCHEAAQIIVTRLTDAVSLPSLVQHHRRDQLSESGLKLIAEPSVPFVSDVLENKHRDSGTLTMLFYNEWSMHICVSDENEQNWVFVPPPSHGCALVHGAKSLARLSGGRLRAPLHRVTQPSDGAKERHFLSYFLRPEHRLSEEWGKADLVVGSG